MHCLYCMNCGVKKMERFLDGLLCQTGNAFRKLGIRPSKSRGSSARAEVYFRFSDCKGKVIEYVVGRV